MSTDFGIAGERGNGIWMWNFREDGGVNTVRPKKCGRSLRLARGLGKMVKGNADEGETGRQ